MYLTFENILESVPMNPENNEFTLNLGPIEGVHISNFVNYADLRGRLFKAYAEGPIPSFPAKFNTFEHFFTESKKNVFRGMHFQGAPHSATKIITIVKGMAIDFLIDMRKDSPTFGTLQIESLSEMTPSSIYIPQGVAHGYISLSDGTIISYRQDVAFCGNCDGGFSGEAVSQHLPVIFANTIRSDKDLHLPELEGFEFHSRCPK